MNITQYEKLIKVKDSLIEILQEEENKKDYSQNFIDDLTQQLDEIELLIPEAIIIKINGKLNFQVTIPYNINIEMNINDLRNNTDLYEIYDILDQNSDIASIINSINMENGEIKHYEILDEEIK
jgi:predicted RNA-binding protein with EMAP domain